MCLKKSDMLCECIFKVVIIILRSKEYYINYYLFIRDN